MRDPVTIAAAPRYRVEVRTPLSTAAAVAGLCVVAALVALPWYAPRTALKDMFFVLTLIGLAQCWNLLAGYAGILSIGQQAYVGAGAYMLFALSIFLDLDPLLSIPLAGALAALLAIPTAKIIFRLNGAYLAVGTWVVAEVFRLVCAQIKSLGGGTGTSLPADVTSGAASVRLLADLMAVRAPVARDILAYWLALTFAVGIVAACYLVLRSRQGLALAAIRDNEAASESIGIDRARTKFWVYCLASLGAALIGALVFYQTARISPAAAYSVTDFTAYVLFVVVIGGVGTIEGPIVGALVLYALRDQLASLGAWYLMLLGLLAVAAMLFFPRGLWGSLAERFDIHLFSTRRRLVMPRGETPDTLQPLPQLQEEH
jgi:branched-chain amino acid transport system permease protein